MRNPQQQASSVSGGGKTTPCCSKVGVKRGPWTAEEDEILAGYINREGEGRWRTLPGRAGLLRCGKSCRLRWMNYLRPHLKRGRISDDEEDLILRLHRLLGNRWSLIAGRIPGRTDNEIKNYWNTHLSKKLISQGLDPRTHKPLENYNPNPTVGSSMDGAPNPKPSNPNNNNSIHQVGKSPAGSSMGVTPNPNPSNPNKPDNNKRTHHVIRTSISGSSMDVTPHPNPSLATGEPSPPPMINQGASTSCNNIGATDRRLVMAGYSSSSHGIDLKRGEEEVGAHHDECNYNDEMYFSSFLDCLIMNDDNQLLQDQYYDAANGL